MLKAWLEVGVREVGSDMIILKFRKSTVVSKDLDQKKKRPWTWGASLASCNDEINAGTKVVSMTVEMGEDLKGRIDNVG